MKNPLENLFPVKFGNPLEVEAMFRQKVPGKRGPVVGRDGWLVLGGMAIGTILGVTIALVVLTSIIGH